jgi:hypothetical protein
VIKGVRFVEAGHRYFGPGDVPLPSVSEIIEPVKGYAGVPKAVLEKARDRGVAVDKATQLFDKDDLDYDSLDPVVVPYLDAWEWFTCDYLAKWTHVNLPEWHQTLYYAGTPDRKGSVRVGGKTKRVTLDIKATYKIERSVILQLSGYDLMDEDGPADELWVVQLKKDGTYVKQVIKPAHDVFLACLKLHNWKARNP